MQKKIERFALRDLVHRTLLERILHGLLPPGSRVKDTDLSQELQVSRTPVREALVRLVQEGFMENSVGRGFMVRPLTGDEVREIYPIIWTLETLALKSSLPLSEAALKEFSALSKAMSKPRRDFITLIELDQQWHHVLLSQCGNRRLLDSINDFKSIAFRYEYAFMQDMALVHRSIEEHQQIADSLFQQGPDAAALLLQDHWAFTMNALLKKIN